MVEYLVTSCGFPKDKAIRASKHLTALRSTLNPDSVLRFLKRHGFDDLHIRRLMSSYPPLLCASVDNSLEPNFRALKAIGFSDATLAQLVVASPHSLILRSASPRIQFWRDFFGGNDKSLLRALKKNKGLITHDIDRNIAPKVDLLQRQGLSTEEIGFLVQKASRLITLSIETIAELVERTKELGFRQESGMFVHGLVAVTYVGRGLLEKKMEMLKRYGWSERDFLSAVRIAPYMVINSEKNLRAKMEFLVREVGCSPAYIASHPVILMYSLEKRLVPRYYVFRVLGLKGLRGKRQDLLSAMTISDQRFVERYILLHKEAMPELQEAFVAACAGRVPTLVPELMS
ncbi:transcription termination factor MTERF2, chloroplastic [Cocos nucifera]|uniref:Transcription termination factor MTERF2, chloroplastic n=1 Tax=Cocos nucifera TaxID=13894 RepID=A0A8K0I9E9_COCNU|nr:transcription termination factor MTERF2, chloroplastic [Cocos nucifera]